MAILKSPMVQPLVDGFCLLLAKIVAAFLGLFDAGIERHGNIVLRYTYGYALAIGKECSALEFVISLTAAILACPISIIKRIKAIVIFALVFQLVNVLRLITLVYAKVLLTPHYFDLFHEQFWVFLLAIFTTSLFFVWARIEKYVSTSQFTKVQA